MFNLHALPDDFNLNALDDTPRGEAAFLSFTYTLTAPNGDILTDTLGNHLTGIELVEVFPQILNALPDDFNLNG